MSRQNIVNVALDLERELEEFDRTKDRSVLIKALRDQYLITKYDSATLVEKSMTAALEILIGRMSNMSNKMLIKTIETLNMFRQNIVDVALDLERELEEFDRTKDRSVLIKALRDQSLITKYDSAALVEKSMTAALEILISRMSNMSDNMLIKTIETLSRIGALDMTAITGSGQLKR